MINQKDIEKLGWVGKNDSYTYYTGKVQLQIDRSETYPTILIQTLGGFKYYNYLESIKNKSDLKRVMKLLGVIS